MSRILIVGLILMAVFLPSAVGAAGKSTVDPNAGRSGVSGAALSGSDLTQKVTYDAKRKTVASILADLSKVTGVTLKAGRNNEDWQVRDRKMNIFAKDVALGDLMSSVARVGKLKWSKSGSGDAVSHRLVADSRALADAEKQRAAQEKELRKRQIEVRKKFLTSMEAEYRTAASNAEPSNTYDPSDTMRSCGKHLAHVLGAVPKAKQAYLNGDLHTQDLASLPADARQELSDAFGIKDANIGSFTITALSAPGDTSMSVWMAGRASPLVVPSTSTGIGSFIVYLNNGQQGVTSCIGIQDSDSELSKLERGSFNVLRQGDQSAVDQYSMAVCRAREKDKLDLGEPAVEHPEDPALSVKMKMKPDSSKLSDTFAALAQGSAFAVVTDSFGDSSWSLSFPSDGTELRTALDKLELICRYNWERHGSVLEFHDRDWCRKLSYLVPEAWLDNWRKTLVESGSLNISQLSQMATLTPEQIGANITPDEVLGGIGLEGVVWQNAKLLSTYYSLDKQQQASVFTSQGLPAGQGWNVKSLVAKPTFVMDSALDTKVAELMRATEDGLRLVGTQKKQGKQNCYTFSVLKASGEVVGPQWKIDSPVYTPPAKQKAKDAKS